MNRILTCIYFVFSLLFLENCTLDEAIEEIALSTEDEVTKIEAVSLPFDIGEGNSRTSITMGHNSIALPIWAKGDTIGIFPSAGGDQLSFPIIDGIGTNTCVFTGGGWALKPSTASAIYTYTAYTPFNRNYYSLKDNTALPINMLGQKQNGNNNSDHLGAYDLQIANGDTPTNGKILFAFQHKVAIVRMDITAPCAATWKSITLNSTAAFTTKATMNLSLSTPTITPKEQSNSITLDLKNVSTTANNLQIVAYMMMLPVNFTNKTLIMELVDNKGNMYTAPVSIDNPTNVANPLIFGASNARWISAKFEKGASPTYPYVTFMADNMQTFSMSKEEWSLEYSVNGGNWRILGDNTVTFGGEYGILQLRDSFNPTGTGTNASNCSRIIFGNSTPVACSGDIRTLLDYEEYTTVDTSNAGFYGLFWGCNVLTSAPKLPATILAESCYENMFAYCSNLRNAPELPATRLADRCYSYMFDGCTSLTTAPELPATTLAAGCYSHMFMYCTNLTVAPELLAKTLDFSCYEGMFYHCENLRSAPKLPATTIAPSCYSHMFSGCEKLEYAPELPATILYGNCYEEMFGACTRLISAPELPATVVEIGCYQNMFYGCISLISAPELPAVTLADMCYSGMFSGCISLISAPKLPAKTLKNYCYSYMFSGCYNLQKMTMLATNIEAEDCLKNWLNGVSYYGTFTKAKEMGSLSSGGSGIPENWTVKNYEE